MCIFFFKYELIQEHFTSIISSEGNRIYNRQSFQLRNNGFRVQGGGRPPILPKYHYYNFVQRAFFTWHLHFLMEAMLLKIYIYLLCSKKGSFKAFFGCLWKNMVLVL
jgi:hypothetical protein